MRIEPLAFLERKSVFQDGRTGSAFWESGTMVVLPGSAGRDEPCRSFAHGGLIHRKERINPMGTYILFGTYTQDALKKISSRRTAGAAALIKKNGGELKSGYALLGDVDIVLVADFPDNTKAMKASIELTRQLGIGFRTAPAVSVEFFDSLMA
jgi:uncharacterized protein with GYD domain